METEQNNPVQGIHITTILPQPHLMVKFIGLSQTAEPFTNDLVSFCLCYIKEIEEKIRMMSTQLPIPVNSYTCSLSLVCIIVLN